MFYVPRIRFVCLYPQQTWQINFIRCYLSVLKEKKSDGKLVRYELKLKTNENY